MAMSKNPKQRGRATAKSLSDLQSMSSQDRTAYFTAAVECSNAETLCGRPFPVQFRTQGAINA
jgi:hypothetical protein